MARSKSHIAWEEARSRLVALHRDEFAVLLDEERHRLGLPLHAERRAERIARLEKELDRLRGESGSEGDRG